MPDDVETLRRIVFLDDAGVQFQRLDALRNFRQFEECRIELVNRRMQYDFSRPGFYALNLKVNRSVFAPDGLRVAVRHVGSHDMGVRNHDEARLTAPSEFTNVDEPPRADSFILHLDSRYRRGSAQSKLIPLERLRLIAAKDLLQFLLDRCSRQLQCASDSSQVSCAQNRKQG